MREKRDFRLRRNEKSLDSEKLAHILRNVTVEKDAAETFERLTGEKIPDGAEQEGD